MADNKIKKLIKEHFYGKALSGLGYTRSTIKTAPPETVKELIRQTQADLWPLFDDKTAFVELLRAALAKEYKLAGIKVTPLQK